MDSSNTRAPASSDPARAGTTKLGLGVFFIFMAALLAIAATILIWFGIFPGLVALGLALPLAISGLRLIRKGQPATTRPE